MAQLNPVCRSTFLRRLDERDEPITSAEADMAGPWSVLPVPGRGFGVFRAGEHPARGSQPFAVFPDRFLALVAAAILPGIGREPLLQLSQESGPEGFAPTAPGRPGPARASRPRCRPDGHEPALASQSEAVVQY